MKRRLDGPASVLTITQDMAGDFYVHIGPPRFPGECCPICENAIPEDAFCLDDPLWNGPIGYEFYCPTCKRSFGREDGELIVY